MMEHQYYHITRSKNPVIFIVFLLFTIFGNWQLRYSYSPAEKYCALYVSHLVCTTFSPFLLLPYFFLAQCLRAFFP